MMKIVLTPTPKKPHARVQVKLRDCLDCSLLAVELLQKVIDQYDAAPGAHAFHLAKIDFQEAHATLRMQALILPEIAGSKGTIRAATFEVIRRHSLKNHCHENAPGAEAALMALLIAYDAIEEALDLMGDDLESDTACLVLATSSAVGNHKRFIECATADFEWEEAVTFAMAGQPIPTAEEMRRKRLGENYPTITGRLTGPSKTKKGNPCHS